MTNAITAGEQAQMAAEVERTFPHRCRVERYTEGAADPYGETAKTWATLTASLACWFLVEREREVLSETQVAAIENVRLIVARTADIRESDRVTSIRNQDDSVVDARTFAVEAATPRFVDQQVLLTVVS